MSASYGQSPHVRKPATALSGVADRRKAFPNIAAMSYAVILLPGLATIQLSAAALYALFRDLKYDLSNGCMLCVQCGGSVIKVIPRLLAYSTAAKVL